MSNCCRFIYNLTNIMSNDNTIVRLTMNTTSRSLLRLLYLSAFLLSDGSFCLDVVCEHASYCVELMCVCGTCSVYIERVCQFNRNLIF